MKRIGITPLLALPLLGFSLTATAQIAGKTASQISLQELLSGKSVALSLRVKDLDSNFARFRFAGDGADDARSMIWRMSGLSAPETIFYTKGDTLLLENTSYLVVYGSEPRIDKAALARHDMRAMMTTPSKLRPKDKLLLSLLVMKNLSNIRDIRPFNREQDLENEADRNTAVVNTLQMLGQGIFQWKHNRGQERFPNWGKRVTPQLRQSVYPFVHDKRLWEHPSTEEPFGLNPVLAGKVVREIPNRQNIYLVYEFTTAADGSRGVLFADAHVERVDAERWARVLKIANEAFSPEAIAAEERRKKAIQEQQMAQMRARREAEVRRLEAETKVARPRRR